MIKNVLIDLDDTLFDFSKAELICIRYAYHSLGLVMTEEMYRRYTKINLAWWQKLERGETTKQELLIARHSQTLREFHISADPELIEEVFRNKLEECGFSMPGADDLLAYLHNRYRLYVISNGTKSTQMARLKKAGWLSMWDGIFISEEFGAEKPSPSFFAAVAKQIPNYSADETILIGDSLTSDILGGMNSGIQTVWFNSKNEDMKPGYAPTYTVSSLQEIQNFL